MKGCSKASLLWGLSNLLISSINIFMRSFSSPLACSLQYIYRPQLNCLSAPDLLGYQANTPKQAELLWKSPFSESKTSHKQYFAIFSGVFPVLTKTSNFESIHVLYWKYCFKGNRKKVLILFLWHCNCKTELPIFSTFFMALSSCPACFAIWIF